ncbi:hypothetical protein [Nocardioides daphniae]|uniref:LppX_LprAFG lipoprotein n=1 Tax=Nocardioides daphniae TaxID=402297 RepID=A0A4P7UJ71_9ACTN|nr:hypothetical protein [Nocardioides daphniae]QCC78489.1 hypothetical protein E2C04_17105 [Nocardioides daphniae]GGD12002.1 hypothetical protein GCM10007231_08610 [Nocardioides daphniae]
MRIGSRNARAGNATMAALALVTGLALAGCSGDDEPEAGPADETLAAAVAAFTDAGTGDYTFQLGDDDEPMIRSEGKFGVADSVATLDLTLTNGERSLRSEHVRVGDDVWFRTSQDSTGPASGCWRAGRPDRASGLLGPGPAESGEGTPAPPAVAVVATAEGEEWVAKGDTVRGTADLFTVASTLGEVVSSLELAPEQTQGRVEVTFLVDGEDVVAWRTDLVTVLRALADSGAELDPEMVRLLDGDIDIPVMAGFSQLGEDVSVEPPSDLC